VAKVALITGGARRIGRAVALGLAHKGYDIALHYNTSQEKAEKTAEEIRHLDSTCRTFRADLGQMDQVQKLVPAVLDAMGQLDLLVNNAAIFEKGHLLETELDLLQRTLDVNLKAPLLLMRDFGRSVEVGQIINFLDTRVQSWRSTYLAYSISKMALADLTRMAARELGPDIRVNGICPGLVLEPPGADAGYLERLASHIPLRKRGGVEDIVSAVLYLVESQFVTGQLLYVDGGEQLL
jgi:NAD(P)-dependent dehydrogenase (short-subunit alcohol dehydrogenase family)